ncbi:hypothetical protein MKC84_02345 [[Clostridium] innocuum]|nr:hypothetical protein [[Clostridium] innocuum]
MKALLPVLYLGALGAVYALVFYFNHKTPLPKGCEDLKAQCKGCHDHSCYNNPAHEE